MKPVLKTLKSAKQELMENIWKGTICPCCGQTAKVYRRKLRDGMAWVMIKMLEYHGTNFVHVDNFLVEIKAPSNYRSDFPKLRFWGLLEHDDSIRKDGSNRNGFWKLTSAGVDFINNETLVWDALFVYNNMVVEYDDPKRKYIDIVEALGTSFNYEELMRGIR